MSTTSHPVEPDCLAINDAEVARLLNISRRHVANLDAEGLLPQPIRLGRSKRWSLPELKAWITAGSPPRAQWEAAKEAGAHV